VHRDETLVQAPRQRGIHVGRRDDQRDRAKLILQSLKGYLMASDVEAAEDKSLPALAAH